MSNPEASIKKHIALAKKGDEKAFGFLLNTFWNDVYNYLLMRYKNENDAEEITITTFAIAFDKIHTFDERYQFKTWLITIAKNRYLDLLRQQKKNILHTSVPQTQEETNELFDVMDDSPTAEDQLIIEQNLKKLLSCIKKLKPPYQEVINLRYFQELSYKEIAERLQEPINNIKIKLVRAKKLLAESIHESYEQHP
jgi:RNA polymerase sigma-70 factor (ECF subfamily)